MTTQLPWSWRQFMSAMRKAGYKSMGHGVYQHMETGYKYQSWEYSKEWGESWKAYAAVHQTPPPF